MKTVAIIGEGAWGTAVATLLAHNGFTVKLWCYDAAVAEQIRTTGFNQRYLPDIRLSPLIIPIVDLKELCTDAEWAFEAIPVKYLRNILGQLAHHTKPQQWVVLSKGIEQKTLMVPSEIIKDVFGITTTVVVSGPSFAYELAQQQPTGFAVASDNSHATTSISKMICSSYVVTETSRDVLGIQHAGALKNVAALGIGILQGAQYGANTQGLFLVKIVREMHLIGKHYGMQTETLWGLAGLGDLVLTSFGARSRNFMVGKRLGTGDSLAYILQETGAIPEGVNTLNSIQQLAQQQALELPLMNELQAIVAGQSAITDLIKMLLQQ